MYLQKSYMHTGALKLQGKEYSSKGPTIRIRVNLQEMDFGQKRPLSYHLPLLANLFPCKVRRPMHTCLMNWIEIV